MKAPQINNIIFFKTIQADQTMTEFIASVFHLRQESVTA